MYGSFFPLSIAETLNLFKKKKTLSVVLFIVYCMSAHQSSSFLPREELLFGVRDDQIMSIDNGAELLSEQPDIL